MTDVWGQAFSDHLEGRAGKLFVERDDGLEHALGDEGPQRLSLFEAT